MEDFDDESFENASEGTGCHVQDRARETVDDEKSKDVEGASDTWHENQGTGDSDCGETRQDKDESHHPLLGQNKSRKDENLFEDEDEVRQASSLKNETSFFRGTEIQQCR